MFNHSMSIQATITDDSEHSLTFSRFSTVTTDTLKPLLHSSQLQVRVAITNPVSDVFFAVDIKVFVVE